MKIKGGEEKPWVNRNKCLREGQCQEGLGMAGKTPGANLKKMSRNEAAEREKPGG